MISDSSDSWWKDEKKMPRQTADTTRNCLKVTPKAGPNFAFTNKNMCKFHFDILKITNVEKAKCKLFICSVG